MHTPEKTILFYTDIPRSFRTTYIGYLFELTQAHSVVLLCEELDEYTDEILQDKTLFPKLHKIIPIYEHTKINMSLFRKHKYFAKLAQSIIKKYAPYIIFSTDYTVFGSYLRRYAHKYGIITLAAIGPAFEDSIENADYRALLSGYRRIRTSLPLQLKLWYGRIRRIIAHSVYYHLFPIMAGHYPFIGTPSCIYEDDRRFNKGADYYIVFSKIHYNRLICYGIHAKKLLLLAHPLDGPGRSLFEKTYLTKAQKSRVSLARKTLIFMWPEPKVSFTKKPYRLIPKEKMVAYRISLLKIIANALPAWRIILKPHPIMLADPDCIKKLRISMQSISHIINIVNPAIPAEYFIELCDAIVNVPPPSTTTFTSTLQCKNKPILFINLHNEILGDSYSNFQGVKYITNEQTLVHTLESINNGTYVNTIRVTPTNYHFISIIDALDKYLIL